ncbi:hypothetical protein ACA910_021788 [Epithemia clementina (nom. ined.)]
MPKPLHLVVVSHQRTASTQDGNPPTEQEGGDDFKKPPAARRASIMSKNDNKSRRLTPSSSPLRKSVTFFQSNQSPEEEEDGYTSFYTSDEEEEEERPQPLQPQQGDCSAIRTNHPKQRHDPPSGSFHPYSAAAAAAARGVADSSAASTTSTPRHSHTTSATTTPTTTTPISDHTAQLNELRSRARHHVLQAIETQIPAHRKVAYVHAMHHAPHVVATESDALIFLWHCQYNVTMAAERLVLYWNARWDLFGPTRACLPLTQTGQGALTSHDVLQLKAGFPALLSPTAQPHGQAVLYCDRGQFLRTSSSTTSTAAGAAPSSGTSNNNKEEMYRTGLRCFFYLAHLLLLDNGQEKQQPQQQDDNHNNNANHSNNVQDQGVLLLVLLVMPRLEPVDVHFVQSLLGLVKHVFPMTFHLHVLNRLPRKKIASKRWQVQDILCSFTEQLLHFGFGPDDTEIHLDRQQQHPQQPAQQQPAPRHPKRHQQEQENDDDQLPGLLQQLLNLGLTTDGIPTALGGTWSFQTFLNWCVNRATAELLEDHTTTMSQRQINPSSYDGGRGGDNNKLPRPRPEQEPAHGGGDSPKNATHTGGVRDTSPFVGPILGTPYKNTQSQSGGSALVGGSSPFSSSASVRCSGSLLFQPQQQQQPQHSTVPPPSSPPCFSLHSSSTSSSFAAKEPPVHHAAAVKNLAVAVTAATTTTAGASSGCGGCSSNSSSNSTERDTMGSTIAMAIPKQQHQTPFVLQPVAASSPLQHLDKRMSFNQKHGPAAAAAAAYPSTSTTTPKGATTTTTTRSGPEESQQQHHHQAAVAAEEQEEELQRISRKRMINAIHSRRKRDRRRVEFADLQKQSQDLTVEHDRLVTQNQRLEALWKKAQQHQEELLRLSSTAATAAASSSTALSPSSSGIAGGG